MKPVADRRPIELPPGWEPERRRRKRYAPLRSAALVAAPLALIAGCLLVGVLAAWLVMGGPEAGYIEPARLWRCGAGLGFALLSGCAISFIIGRTGG